MPLVVTEDEVHGQCGEDIIVKLEPYRGVSGQIRLHVNLASDTSNVALISKCHAALHPGSLLPALKIPSLLC